jgi:hypothetical protein
MSVDCALVVSDELLAAYREMGADRERESEAEKWSEALISDAVDETPPERRRQPEKAAPQR